MSLKNMSDYILGIESSCDDTSAAVIKDGFLLSNVIASQQVHKDYGGVVPELASRAHEQNIVPVVSQALSKAGIKAEDLTAIAFTRGPGLLGSLLVGTSFAKALGVALDRPSRISVCWSLEVTLRLSGLTTRWTMRFWVRP